MYRVKFFVDILCCFHNSNLKKDILEDMDFFLERERDFLCFSQVLESEGSAGENFECLNDKLSKINLFFGDTIDFLLSLNQFIFNVLDELDGDEVSLDFKVPRRDFSSFYKKHISFFEKRNDYGDLSVCLEKSKNYVIKLLNDPFFERKIFSRALFLLFRENYCNFIDLVDAYAKVCEERRHISFFLRGINIYMMAMINCLEQFRLSVGSLWLFL